MQNVHLGHLRLVILAAALTSSTLVGGAGAQTPSEQPPPQQPERPSRDEEPRSVSQQLQEIKRQQRQETTSGERAPVRDADHQVEVRVRNYMELKRRNIVMQRRDYSCGAATLATIARYYWGDDVTEDMFLRALDEILTAEEIEDRIENGLAMSDLRKAAVKMGYQSVVGKTTFQKLTEVKVPVIVGISPGGHDHFVVYRGTNADWVYVADPIRGNVRMPIWEFRKQWQENAVLVIHKPGHKVKERSPLSLRDDETRLGELNLQLIQTQQSRQPRIKQSLPR